MVMGLLHENEECGSRSNSCSPLTHSYYEQTLGFSADNDMNLYLLTSACQRDRRCCCADVTPYFTCPTLSDPAVINRQWIEFYCEFTTTSNDPQAVFVVQFLFDGTPASNVPDFTINGRTEQTRYSAKLHERYLQGQLDKTVRQTTQHGRNQGC